MRDRSVPQVTVFLDKTLVFLKDLDKVSTESLGPRGTLPWGT